MIKYTAKITNMLFIRMLASGLCIPFFPIAVVILLNELGLSSLPAAIWVPGYFLGFIVGGGLAFCVWGQLVGKYKPKCPYCQNPDTRFEVDENSNQVFICDSCGLEEAVANLDD